MSVGQRRRAGSAALLLALLGSLLGSLLAATPARAGVGPEDTVEGVVRLLVAEATPGSGASHPEPERVLVTDGGDTYFLEGPAGATVPVNREVTVTGRLSGDELRVSSVSVGRRIAGVPPVGTTRVLLMLATWTQPSSVTTESARAAFFDDAGAWFADNSYGALRQVGDVTGWLQIAGPTGGCYADNATIMAQAQAAAVAAGYDLGAYDNYAVYFPFCGGDAAGYAGWAYVGSSGTWFNGYLDRRVITHEQGHNYGLLHAHSMLCDRGGLRGTCAFSEYGDILDAMGSSSYVGHFNAAEKAQLGWLTGGRLVDETGDADGLTTTLVPMADDGTAAHAVKVTAPGGARSYWVEYRQLVDYDGWLPESALGGLVVHLTGLGTGSSDVGSSLIDVSPGNGTDVYTAVLPPGSAWTSEEGIHLRSGPRTPAGAQVGVFPLGTVPLAPGGLSVRPTGPGSAAVTWSAPADDGGRTIDGYVVSRTAADGSSWSTVVDPAVTGVTLDGLAPGAAYTLTVAARNERGTGPEASTRLTLGAVAPGAPVLRPARSGVRGGRATAMARWRPPAATGGTPVAGYRVRALRIGPAGTVVSTRVSGLRPAGTRSLTMRLVRNARYRFTVQAVNAVGAGPQSARSNRVVAR